MRALYDNDFTHFAGTSRKPAWRTITSRKRAAQTVLKVAAFPQEQENSDLIDQTLEPQPYQKGRLLVHDWLTAIINSDNEAFQTLVSEYHHYLKRCEEQGNFKEFAYDLLPFNIVIKGKENARELCAIDPEWSFKHCLLYTSPSPRDQRGSRMPSSA